MFFNPLAPKLKHFIGQSIKDILKDALKAFDGTLILVSHDRDFLDGLANKVFEFGGKRIKEHFEDINGFLRNKKMENLREIERTAK